MWKSSPKWLYFRTGKAAHSTWVCCKLLEINLTKCWVASSVARRVMQQASKAGEGDKGRKVWNCIQLLLQHKGLFHSTKVNFASQSRYNFIPSRGRRQNSHWLNCEQEKDWGCAPHNAACYTISLLVFASVQPPCMPWKEWCTQIPP